MLEFFRKWLKGPVAAAVLLLIAIPLAVTFGNMDAGTTVGSFAAKVNGEPIARREFDRIYDDQLALRQQAAEAPLPPEALSGLRREVLDQLVLNRAIVQFVDGLGFRVGDARVADAIRGQAPFQVGGAFSKPAYEAALAARQVTPTAYEEDQRSLLTLTQLQDGLLDGAFLTPAEYRRYLEVELERRTAAWVLLDTATLGADLAVADADIEAYYTANAERFRSDESAALEYVEIGLSDMARDYAPDEAELRAAYDAAEPGRFRTAEERRASHILLTISPARDEAATRKLAGELAGRLAGGADFAALAREYSGDPGSAGKGGDLGFAGRGAYVPEFEAALFALASPGAISPPVRTQFGVHLIRLDEIKPGSERGFDAVRAEIADELRRQKAQDEFLAAAERLDDVALENPGSLEPVAKALGVGLQRIDRFTRAGGGPFGADRRLVEAVFAEAVLTGAENTPLIELDDGRALVARVTEHRLPAPLPLAQVRGAVIEALRAERATTVARERGATILAAVEGGTDLTVAAGGLPVTGPLPLGRRATAIPAELVQAVFRAPRPADGKPVYRGVDLPGGYAVLRLDAVEPGDPDQIPRELRDQRKQQLARQVGIGEVESLAEAVRAGADVVVAGDVLAADTDAAP
jgi:peptidyl-prolyl cis-trans isomerase D